jgi:anthranilate synthase component 1
MKTIYTQCKSLLADQYSPVNLYLNLRDTSMEVVMLESSVKDDLSKSVSYIGADPLETFVRKTPGQEVLQDFKGFLNSIQFVGSHQAVEHAVFMGYSAYDMVPSFEPAIPSLPLDYPVVRYSLYRRMIVIDHYHDTLHLLGLAHDLDAARDELMKLEQQIKRLDGRVYGFEKIGEESSDFSDETFTELVGKVQSHHQRGDVFQMVVSRAFRQKFVGDDFQVYRQLRSINPSPYLFYFDYGDYRLMGSSPESQIRIQDREAKLYPIAGTFRRTGDMSKDQKIAQDLLEDQKEASEHVMLVDLARNDLSKYSQKVELIKYRSIEFYSHVIHLVSEVTGSLYDEAHPLDVFASTFPAGTLSGAPKVKAIELIQQYERSQRGFYGGCIGLIQHDGSMNQAIMIRSLLSKDQVLTYRAGAGIVAASVPDLETREVHNKIDALRAAIRQAEDSNVIINQL